MECLTRVLVVDHSHDLIPVLTVLAVLLVGADTLLSLVVDPEVSLWW